MSFLKSIGKALNVVKDIGLPILGTAIGGPLGGIAAGALAKSVGHGKPTVGNALTGAATGALAGFGGSALKGAGGLLGGLGGAGAATGETAGLGGGLGGSLGGVTSLLGGLTKLAPLALGAVGAVQSAHQASAANDLQQQAIDMAKARDAELSPLRSAGIAAALDRFQHPVTPYDAVGGYVDAGNPYSTTPRGAPTAGVPLARRVTPLLLAQSPRRSL